MTRLTITRALTEADWQAVRAVREAVFVREQACPPDEEWDAHDAPGVRGTAVHHLLGAVGDAPAACARWRVVRLDAQEAVKLERFAVLQPFRGRGAGRAIVAAALADARAAGHSRFVLNAQSHLDRFYASFGFTPVGGLFREAGIEHVKMTLADGGAV